MARAEPLDNTICARCGCEAGRPTPPVHAYGRCMDTDGWDWCTEPGCHHAWRRVHKHNPEHAENEREVRRLRDRLWQAIRDRLRFGR